MRLRNRTAWFLRGIAKRINALAERLEPVKASLPAKPTAPLNNMEFVKLCALEKRRGA